MVVGFLALVILKESVELVPEYLRRRKRRAEVAAFRANATEANAEYDWVQNLYVRGGGPALLTLYHLLQTPERVFELADWAAPVSDVSKRQVRNRAVQLLKQNAVRKVDNQVVVDNAFRDFVTEFTKVICQKGSADELTFEFPY